MAQEDKELLMKDLCSRLPYGVKCYGYCFKIDGNHCECYGTLDSIKLGVWWPFHLSNRVSINNGATYEETFSDVKPYLFPLSSMTEEQKRDLTSLFKCCIIIKQYEIDFPNYEDSNMDNWMKVCTWCYKNHIDIHGLIEKGLAEDATDKNIY